MVPVRKVVALAAAMGRSAVPAAVASAGPVMLDAQANFTVTEVEDRPVPVARPARIGNPVAQAERVLATPGKTMTAAASRLPMRRQVTQAINPRQLTIRTVFQVDHSKVEAPRQRQRTAQPQLVHPAADRRRLRSRQAMELHSAPVPAAEWTPGLAQ
jgi:hypothetical protein